MDKLIKDGQVYVRLDSSFWEEFQKSEITLSFLYEGDINIIPRIYNSIYFSESYSCLYLITAKTWTSKLKYAEKIVMNCLNFRFNYYLKKSIRVELVQEENIEVTQFVNNTYSTLSNEIEIYKIKSIKENENA